MPYMSIVRKDNLEFIVKVNCDLHEQNILEYLHSKEQWSDYVIQLESMCLPNLETRDSTTYLPTCSRTNEKL